MRHRLAFRRLGRGYKHRKALLRNLTTQLIKHERIRTTVAKAKELRDEIVTSRQVVANAARKQQQSNKEAKDKTLMFAAGGIKDTHDTIYKKKFVPKQAAEALTNSKYATSVS